MQTQLKIIAPPEMEPEKMHEAAESASALLKTIANKDRLIILCQLGSGEKTVSELVDILGIPQSPISQHLARMRNEDLVNTRRDGKSIHYSLKCANTAKVIELLYSMYCDV